MVLEVKWKKSHIRQSRKTKQADSHKTVSVEKEKMVAKQSMTQAITQGSNNDSQNLVTNARPIQTISWLDSPTLKQLTFDLKATGKYHELCNFGIQVKNIFITNNYNIQESEKFPITVNWFGHKGLRLLNEKEH